MIIPVKPGQVATLFSGDGETPSDVVRKPPERNTRITDTQFLYCYIFYIIFRRNLYDSKKIRVNTLRGPPQTDVEGRAGRVVNRNHGKFHFETRRGTGRCRRSDAGTSDTSRLGWYVWSARRTLVVVADLRGEGWVNRPSPKISAFLILYYLCSSCWLCKQKWNIKKTPHFAHTLKPPTFRNTYSQPSLIQIRFLFFSRHLQLWLN